MAFPAAHHGLTADDLRNSPLGCWGIDPRYLNYMEGVMKRLGEFEAGTPQRVNHSPKENWREILGRHIAAQFQADGQLHAGRAQPRWDGGRGVYTFANIAFYVNPLGDPNGRTAKYRYIVCHFPTPAQSAGGDAFYS
eukprot:gb/GFBE01057662.1/.p1 GENE.gb/GFBE01057662.1/~~gb/GFBE01057662.1/.p1  ORF type:complete len:137 (+),score=9.65 gb/GFBE01057662.1/:1-411(+)